MKKNVSSISFSFDVVHSFCFGCRDSQGWFFLRFVALAALILAAILIGCILLRRFVKSGIFSGKTCNTYYRFVLVHILNLGDWMDKQSSSNFLNILRYNMLRDNL